MDNRCSTSPAWLRGRCVADDERFQGIHLFKDFKGRIGRLLFAVLRDKPALSHVKTAPFAPASHRQ